jgi:2-polyprenyl-3-methyl-5-hydroxy-6-metoxy-1,4-benzoquinol methylase
MRNLYLRGYIYRILIDPLLSGVRTVILRNIDTGNRVVDIACGTGSLALSIARASDQVTGIDLDRELISYASVRANKKGLRNRVQFKVLDATDLSDYRDSEFDVAVTSMSVHQFEHDLAVDVLREMKRVAARVIIADYNYPMPAGLSKSLAYGIERMARGDHHRNFKVYMNKGGLNHFTALAGLSVKSQTVRGNGVFIIVNCD